MGWQERVAHAPLPLAAGEGSPCATASQSLLHAGQPLTARHDEDAGVDLGPDARRSGVHLGRA